MTASPMYWSVGPFACTGQPRCAQWFEMTEKLGTCGDFGLFGSLGVFPLLRMNAVRRETAPSTGSLMKVVMYHRLSLKFEIDKGRLVLLSTFSVSHVVGTGATAQIYKYKLAGPGEHVDGPEQVLYPIQPPHN